MGTPGLPAALGPPSDFFPLIGMVADMAKGPFMGPLAPAALLRPKLLKAGLPLGAPGFLSAAPSFLAAPRKPF